MIKEAHLSATGSELDIQLSFNTTRIFSEALFTANSMTVTTTCIQLHVLNKHTNNLTALTRHPSQETQWVHTGPRSYINPPNIAA